MARSRPQNLGNHVRYVPLYHFVCGGLLVVYLGRAAHRAWRTPTVDAVFDLLLALALGLLFWYAREFAVSVQDRVIRLEMRLRLQGLLAPEDFARFDSFTPGQLAALRFASDAELPALVRGTLEGRYANPHHIKQAIRDWQADHWRA